MRLSGLVSQMDTENMIQQLMKAERVKFDKVYQDRQVLKWRQEIYNDLNKNFANFILNTKKEFGLVHTNSAGSNIPSTNLGWMRKAVSSDEDIAKVSTNGKAVNGSYKVKVDQLAEGVSGVSESNITVSGGDKSNIASQLGLDPKETMVFEIETKNGKVKFAIGSDADSHKGDGIVVINKPLDQVNMSSVVNAINNSKIKKGDKEVGLGIKAVYDSTIDRFFIQTTDTGKDATLSISAGSNTGEDFINKLNLNITSSDNSNPTKLSLGSSYKGKNAIIDFNGAKDIELSSNQFTINGINFELKKTGEFTVNVDTDVDSAYDKIKKFVEEYNKIIDDIGTKLGEKKYKDYKPLTDEQKKDMSEKDIELWEKKAKSGVLRNDIILSEINASLRGGLYQDVKDVEGIFKHLTEIGITTEKYSSKAVGGKLVIDEERLKEALKESVDSVVEILFKEPTGDLAKDDDKLSKEQLKEKRAQSGIITRMYDNLTNGIKNIIDKSGVGEDKELFRQVKSYILMDFVTGKNGTGKGSISVLDEDIFKLDKKMDDLNVFLFKKEQSYYAKFTAMEKALQRVSSQSSWLAQQFGGGM